MDENKKKFAKPPLGLMPRYIWSKKRTIAIIEAMERYSSEDYLIPIEWIIELKELCMNDCANSEIRKWLEEEV